MLITLGTLTGMFFSAPAFDLISDPGAASTYASAISGDGKVVVGQAQLVGDGPPIEAYRWAKAAVGGVFELIGDFPGGLHFGSAEGVDRRGETVVGVGWRGLKGAETPANPDDKSGIQVAFKWTRTAGLVDLGELPGGTVRAIASDISADGSVIVGSSYDARDDFVAYLLADGVFAVLGAFPAARPRSDARAVSADGSVVVGGSPTDEPGGGTGTRSFAWTEAGGLVDLGDLAGGGTFSSVADVSGDGKVAVGGATSKTSGTGDLEAFRVVIGKAPSGTAEPGPRTPIGLGDLPGGTFYSEALACNADGSVVVGRSAVTEDGQEEAFVWTERGGMERLADVAARSGLTLPAGLGLGQATDVSADGLVFIGNAIDAEGRVSAFRIEVSEDALPHTTVPDLPGGSPDITIDRGDDGCQGGAASVAGLVASLGAALARRAARTRRCDR